MLAGKFLGSIAQLIIRDLVKEKLMLNGVLTEQLLQEDNLPTSFVSHIEGFVPFVLDIFIFTNCLVLLLIPISQKSLLQRQARRVGGEGVPPAGLLDVRRGGRVRIEADLRGALAASRAAGRHP